MEEKERSRTPGGAMSVSPLSVTNFLCDQGQIASPLWASVPLPEKGGD